MNIKRTLHFRPERCPSRENNTRLLHDSILVDETAAELFSNRSQPRLSCLRLRFWIYCRHPPPFLAQASHQSTNCDIHSTQVTLLALLSKTTQSVNLHASAFHTEPTRLSISRRTNTHHSLTQNKQHIIFRSNFPRLSSTSSIYIFRSIMQLRKPSRPGGEGPRAGQHHLGELGVPQDEALLSSERHRLGVFRSSACCLRSGA